MKKALLYNEEQMLTVEIYMNEYGSERVKCPICGCDMMLECVSYSDGTVWEGVYCDTYNTLYKHNQYLGSHDERKVFLIKKRTPIELAAIRYKKREIWFK